MKNQYKKTCTYEIRTTEIEWNNKKKTANGLYTISQLLHKKPIIFLYLQANPQPLSIRMVHSPE